MNLNNRNLIGELTGGLGNQLFVLAATVGLADKTGLNPAYSLRGFGSENPRKFEIHDVCNEFGMRRQETYDYIFQESQLYEFDQLSPNSSGNTLLQGYFQNINYFKHIGNDIRSLLLKSWHVKADLGHVEKIAIHQRRGDYLLPQYSTFHGVSSTRYFTSAVRTLRAIWGPLPVVIFSDSPEEGIFLSKEISDAEYFDDRGLSATEVLIEIARFRHLVGSNSSFSWWAAFLADHKYGDVIFPKPWILGHDADGLMFDGWIRLPIEGIE